MRRRMDTPSSSLCTIVSSPIWPLQTPPGWIRKLKSLTFNAYAGGRTPPPPHRAPLCPALSGPCKPHDAGHVNYIPSLLKTFCWQVDVSFSLKAVVPTLLTKFNLIAGVLALLVSFSLKAVMSTSLTNFSLDTLVPTY